MMEKSRIFRTHLYLTPRLGCMTVSEFRYDICYKKRRLMSVECITHAGRSIAFLHFVTLWPWPFDLILIVGRGIVMDYPCASLVTLVSFVLVFVVGTNTQTDRNTHTQRIIHMTRIIAILTWLPSAWVIRPNYQLVFSARTFREWVWISYAAYDVHL